MMEYFISVAKNGRFYFRTQQVDCYPTLVAFEMFEVFKKRFPKEEGFSVTLYTGKRQEFNIYEE